MASDRARISFDPSRTYRSVVAQQGRVTLEADVNEAEVIASEERRLEAIDVIGPAGTPDDGYAVSAAGADLVVGVGTMYLGGWRLTLGQPVKLSAQPDWLDRPPRPLANGDEVVALLVTEQAVCAVEDQALREVALGGPDTAARTRLMQHFLNLPTGGATCLAGLQDVKKLLAADGVALDPLSLMLVSTARLQVGFDVAAAPAGPCDPPVQGGYLGADNQTICVTVTSYDPATKTGKLAWSWNNASFLYRATASDAQTLKFLADPVDTEHQPRLGQAVEILRTTCDLTGGDYIAAPAGVMMTLAQAYASDTRILALPAPLPAAYLADGVRPLFVRLWETEVDFTSGKAALLAPSGLTVTLTLDALPAQIAGRPFWSFSARPSTPVEVYPRRYLDGPQAPDGPHQWLCDLAVVSVKGETVSVIDDCRLPFDPLTRQKHGECCSVVVAPEDVGGGQGLQALIDSMAGSTASVALRPGTYVLARPLILRAGLHDRLVLEACNGAVTLTGKGEGLAAGLVILDRVPGVTLRGLTFAPPLGKAPGELGLLLQRLEGGVTPPAGFVAASSISVMAIDAADATIEECAFEHRLPPDSDGYLGLGVYLRGESRGLTVRANRFSREPVSTGPLGPWRLSIGIGALTQTPDRTVNAVSVYAADLGILVDDAEISDNRFDGWSVPVLIMAQMGLVRCFNNRVRDCAGGFYFLSPDAGQALEIGRLALTNQDAFTTAMTTASDLPLGMMSAMAEAAAVLPVAIDDNPPAPAPAQEQGGTQLAAQDFRQQAVSLAAQLMVSDQPVAAPAAAADTAAAATTSVDTRRVLARSLATGAAAPAAEAPRTFAADELAASLKVLSPFASAARLVGQLAHPELHLTDNDLEIRGTETPAKGKVFDIFRLAAESALTRFNAAQQQTTDATDAAARIRAQAATTRLEINPAAAAAAAGAAAAAPAPPPVQPAPNSRAGTPTTYDGIRVMLAHGANAGSVLMSGNRVRTAADGSYAARVDWPEEASVVGNVFVDTSTADKTTCFALLADLERSWVSVSGNVVRGNAVIHAHKDPSTTDKWESLNTIRR